MTNKQAIYTKSFYTKNCDKKQFGSFEKFLKQIGEPPKKKSRLTRRCIKKGFVPGNIMWADSVNKTSKYLITTMEGNTASLKAACEQDGVGYSNVANFIKRYELSSCPQSVFNFYKMDKNMRTNFRKRAFIKQLTEML